MNRDISKINPAYYEYIAELVESNFEDNYQWFNNRPFGNYNGNNDAEVLIYDMYTALDILSKIGTVYKSLEELQSDYAYTVDHYFGDLWFE